MRMQQKIESIITAQLSPDVLIVKNESFMHGGDENTDSHFKIVIVTPKFEGLRLLQRHRLVQDHLNLEVQPYIRAVSLETHTPAEWKERGETVTRSPSCHTQGEV